MPLSYSYPRVIYEIRVQGELDQGWQQWFNGLDVTFSRGSAQEPSTTLTGAMADQSALRGILCKLWDLNLTLTSVRRIEVGDNKEQVHG